MKTMDGESVATSVVTTGDESLERPNAFRLDSWKDIANYLNRSVRTVQRWEMVEAMPVHRHCHGIGGSVYAFSHEVEVKKSPWLHEFPHSNRRHWAPWPTQNSRPFSDCSKLLSSSSGKTPRVRLQRHPLTTRMACWPMKTVIEAGENS